MNMDKQATYWIKQLEMIEHPEGGYFKETYRSEEEWPASTLPERYGGARTFGTSIYFLLTRESVSNFHRLTSDEIWHFHTGGAGKIHFLSEDGAYFAREIGPELEQGEHFQVLIPKGHWFAAEVSRGDYLLVGCTVSPGFEFQDFELANRETLLSAMPQHTDLIQRFTKP